MVMVGVLEAAKLVTCAWLARHWRVTPWLLRLPLIAMVSALMTLTAMELWVPNEGALAASGRCTGSR
jgi:hypothetical protein